MPEDFDRPVAPGGYAWWYFDALSDDGQRAFTAIFFRGSVFSPDYASRVRRGLRPSADEHLGVNLALYERGRQVAWVMSEYGSRALVDALSSRLAIARSSVTLTPGGVRIEIDDKSAPFFASLAGVGSAVRGVVEIDAGPAGPLSTLVGSDGVPHEWAVRYRRARVRVRMERPGFSFDGVGYHDTNRSDGRLESAFARWSWARFHGERTTILYSVQDRTGGRQALVVDDDSVQRFDDAEDGPLRRAAWGLELPRWFSVGSQLRGVPGELLEAAPFYARYTGDLVDGERVVARGLGEYLDLDRFRGRGIQFLLRFKTRKVS